MLNQIAIQIVALTAGNVLDYGRVKQQLTERHIYILLHFNYSIVIL
jgi:hypothetical protein